MSVTTGIFGLYQRGSGGGLCVVIEDGNRPKLRLSS